MALTPRQAQKLVVSSQKEWLEIFESVGNALGLRPGKPTEAATQEAALAAERIDSLIPKDAASIRERIAAVRRTGKQDSV